MSLTEEEVGNIAHLARLQLDSVDAKNYTKDLSNILDLFAEMDKVDTKAIEPMAHPMELTQRFRKDEITENDQHELFQSIAPKVEAALYLVPQVIE